MYLTGSCFVIVLERSLKYTGKFSSEYRVKSGLAKSYRNLCLLISSIELKGRKDFAEKIHVDASWSK